MLKTDAKALSLPESVARFTGDCPLYINDVGRSDATVVFADKDGGLYLKIDAPLSLKPAADMQRFLHSKNMAAELVYYESSDRDYLVSLAAAGECALSKRLLNDPARLTVMLAEAARGLHALNASGCPNPDKTAQFLREFDSLCSKNAAPRREMRAFLKIDTADVIIETVNARRDDLASDTVIHGDMCLPNFMFTDNAFSAFIDLNDGGVGDRHYDIFWVLWSMWYNFKTDAYTDLFLDSYGRDKLDTGLVRACGCLCAF